MKRSELLKEMLDIVKVSVDTDIYQQLDACIIEIEEELEAQNSRLKQLQPFIDKLRNLVYDLSNI